MRFATVASPTYLAGHGKPLKPSDIASHQLLPNRYLCAIIDWHFRNSGRDVQSHMQEFSAATVRRTCARPLSLASGLYRAHGTLRGGTSL
ncbi:hypothetical protein GAO09_00140 [Rhizobiales bacterium RZME27]|jgi:hypothetical protein|uniref:LysR substrate-binding domain-containing protein n=1 Tax=Endobacterium cereale TaxID=2663029 RepID=A0A6A8A104_9HYPH|nr:hypothetical protein [Endobacterium cereale]